MSVIVARKEAVENNENLKSNFAQVLFICCLINSRKKPVLMLFDSGSKVNTVHLTFTKKLGLPIRPTDVGEQKIDGITLNIYGMVIATFLVTDKANQVRFFEETFLVANISPKVIFGMPFLTLNSTNIDFLDQKLWYRTYIIEKAFLTIRYIKLMGKKKFAVAVFDLENEIFVVYIVSLNSIMLPNSFPLKLDVYPS